MACMLRVSEIVLTNTQVRINIYMFLLTLSGVVLPVMGYE